MKKAILIVAIAVIIMNASVVFAADGWASENGGTTGGAGGTVVTVTNFADLETYAETDDVPYIIQISGTIDIGSGLAIESNKTLIGIGENPTLVGLVGFSNRQGNIIVENLNITNPYEGSSYDGFSIKQDIHNVVVTKCTVYDTGDGALDISNNTDYVTVSWCKFHYTENAPDPGHTFACLVGSSDKQTDDAANLRVTFHHNWWTTGVKERMPRVRYGQVHVYNNYYSDLVYGGYCVGVGCGSRIRVESNYFDSVYTPWKDYYSEESYPAGHIGWNAGNVYDNCTEPVWASNEYSTIFTPPYAYTLDDASVLPAMVTAYAGAGTPYPPHWVKSMYGDFDEDGDVDDSNLETFLDYWLDTVDIDNADYDSSGKVDIFEFALFAENWLVGV